MTEADIFNTVWPYILAYVAGHGGGLLLTKIRAKVHDVRLIVDAVDNAMTNPSVTEAQAQATWAVAKDLLTK